MSDAPVRHAAWDGLRGVAVAAVLIYHVEGHPLPGGFLGVSLFFTLSGFVITRGLVGELERSDRVSLTGFWARRFRRLLPPIAVALGLVLLYGHVAATGNQRAALRWDMIATLTDWMNWRTLATGATYGGQELDPSPLLHAWSLSIEEQAYVVLPLLAMLGWRLGRRRGMAIALSAVLAASFISGLLSAGDAQAWYLGTHVRIGEIVVGGLLAVAWGTPTWTRLERIARVLGVPAAGYVVWAAFAAQTGESWLPRGGLLVHALATATLIAAATGGGWRAALGWRPLAALGTISYGVYLYHWPVYLWLTPAETGWGTWPTTALRLAVTVALASASYALLERRVVALRRRPERTLTLGGSGIAIALGIAAIAAPAASAQEKVTLAEGDIAPANAEVAGTRAARPPTTTAAPPTPAPTAAPVAAPPTIAADTNAVADADPLASVALGADAVTGLDWVTARLPGSTGEPSGVLLDPLIVPGSTAAPAGTEFYGVPDYASPGSPWFADRTDGANRLNGLPFIPVPLERPPVILVVGDSAAGTLALGLQEVSEQSGAAIVYSSTRSGCPITEVTRLRWNRDVEFAPDEKCSQWPEDAPAFVADVQPDLVVGLVSVWEVADRQLAPDAPWQSITDAEVQAGFSASLAAYTDTFAPNGTRMLWLLPPPLKNSIYAKVDGPLVEEDPARLAALDQLLADFAASRPNTYTYDMGAALEDRYGDPYGLVNRVDGFHWSDAGRVVDAEWLLPLLVSIANGG